MLEIINEASTYLKKYKCPFCDFRADRKKLVYHIDRKHENLIPEDSSALRMVFNIVNKKDHGTCIICKKEAPWNEQNGRYDRICQNPACMKAYKEMIDQRMINTHGVRKLTSVPEHQEKMLAGRKISGTYKWSDSTEKEYTGSFERNALEFLDNILECHSWDVTTPGPIINYEYNGETHFYISDIYYIPYNLIIEVKDGGSNPNMREMKEYREKQIAKERQIIKDKKYNYLRLTNNNFEQLLQIFSELKMVMQDGNDEKIIRIHEHMAAFSNGMLPVEKKQHLYLAPYMMNTVFAGCCLSKGLTGDQLITVNKDTHLLEQHQAAFLAGKGYKMYEIHESVAPYIIQEVYDAFINKEEVDDNFLMEVVSIYTKKGRLLKEELTMENRCNFITESTIADIMRPNIFFESAANLNNENTDFSIQEDANGYFALYKDDHRTASVESVDLLMNYINESTDPCYYYASQYNVNHNLSKKDFTGSIPSAIRKWYRDNNVHMDDEEEQVLLYIYSSDESYKNIKKYGTVWANFKNSGTKDPIVKWEWENKPASLNESLVFNEKDIKYNQDKFESGEIKLCLMLGHLKSGKSTDAKNMNSKDDTISIELNDILTAMDTKIEYLKKMKCGEIFYDYCTGIGKEFYDNAYGLIEKNQPAFLTNVITSFAKYLNKYLTSGYHGKKVVIECHGTFMDLNPANFVKWAVYIKGTSILVSKFRHMNHMYKISRKDGDNATQAIKFTLGSSINSKEFEASLKTWRTFFSNRIAKNISEPKLMEARYYNSDTIISEEDIMNENKIFNQKDLYYNKEKFDNGEINLCFITGLSGSGKSTMAKSMKDSNTIHCNLDGLLNHYDNEEEMRKWEGGELFVDYMNSSNHPKQSDDETIDEDVEAWVSNITNGFIDWIISYAKSHKDKKFVVEGIYLYWVVKPSKLADYAVYIKGTSMLVSSWRCSKRDANDVPKSKLKGFKDTLKLFLSKSWKTRIDLEKRVQEYRNFFAKRIPVPTDTPKDTNKIPVNEVHYYDPPLAYSSLPEHLKNDPVNSWRAKEGIELIHQEPTLKELKQIWTNWKSMSDDMKSISDKKSMELFGMNNEDHYNELIKSYNEAANDSNKLYRFTAKGTGIYEALKRKLVVEDHKPELWRGFLKSNTNDWLDNPHETTYKNKDSKYESYFTYEGYKKFESTTLKMIKKYLDEKDIIIKTYIITDLNKKGRIAYQDKYQIVYEFNKPLNKSTLLEFNTSNQLYFVSTENFDKKVLAPRVPNNYFTRNGFEDSNTSRVCFSTSLEGAIMGLSQCVEGANLYVHSPIEETEYYTPTTEQVPDANISKEVWVQKPIRVKCIGMIKVNEATTPHKFTYGDNEAELWEWDYKWIRKD